MKNLLFAACCYSALMISCNNSSGNSDDNPNSKADPTSAASSAGMGTISCTIDGKQIAMNAKGFSEINLDPYSKGPKDGILLAVGDGKTNSLQIEMKKSGVSKIRDNATQDINCIINYYNPEGVTYTGSDVTVTVTSYDGNKLTGTFSGKLVNVNYDEGDNKNEKSAPQFIQVTDGKLNCQR
ncbi:MAG TPA: hypothetical protein VGI82_09340 [Chitinophagaceae bacterium]